MRVLKRRLFVIFRNILPLGCFVKPLLAGRAISRGNYTIVPFYDNNDN